MDIEPQEIQALLQAIQDQTADLNAAIQNVPSALILDAVPKVGQLLIDSEQNVSVHQRAILTLRALDRSEAVPFLGEALTENDNNVIRRLSVAALEQVDLMGGVPYFNDALQDNDEAVHESAAYALGTAVSNSVPNLDVDDAILHQQADNLIQAIGTTTLSTLLTTDNRPEARQAAATALGYLADPNTLTVLCHALQRDDETPGVLWNIISALRKIGTPAAVPCLGRALIEDASNLVRQQVAGALEQINDPSAIPFLAQALVEDQAEGVRKAALSALVKITDWQSKTNRVIEFLQNSRQERATIDSIGIVRAIKPPANELVREK
ncbi:MAG: HEAT repeat domain-containing protein, partial [Anaerolineales bacterium]|nr:HEAT repeat domain-containing protein [Anaerolineales bacterium]